MSIITLADRIDGLLPQTQCTKCGYDGCRPYAAAIAAGEADINRCPPGGEDGVRALAALLDTPAPPLEVGRAGGSRPLHPFSTSSSNTTALPRTRKQR